MMTPTKHRKKIPLQELRKNPFSSRNAYPSLDQAFHMTPTCPKASSNCFSPDRSSSIVAPSELDLSIGARADLYEHHRHIMKYGLDHDGQKYQEECTSVTVDEWEHIMDGNLSHASYSSTFIMDSNPMSFLKGVSYSNRHHVDGSSDADVDADTTSHSDYFNSSKVFKLNTPEKNRSKVDEASRLARMGFIGMAHQEVDRNGNIHDFDESSMMDESGGMIGLFQAAMKIGLDESHGIIQDEEHAEGGEEEGRAESFISYQEPNLSVANFDGTETNSSSNQDVNDDDDENENHSSSIEIFDIHSSNGSNVIVEGHTSFISFRDPNLSVLSGRSGPMVGSPTSHLGQLHHSNYDEGEESEFQSDFEVMIGPDSELDTSVSPTAKRNVYTSSKGSGLPRSRSKLISKSLKTPVREKNVSPLQSTIKTPGSTNSTKYKNHSSIRWPDEHSPPNLSQVSMSRLREVQAFYSSGKGSSPVKNIANSVKSVDPTSQLDTEDAHIHCNPMKLQTNTLTLSPIEYDNSSQRDDNRKNGGVLNPPIDSNCRSISKSKPKRLTLRDRYTRPDRFEDNFSVPSSTSTLNSSPQSISDDSPVNRSLLESFETASYSRFPRFEM
jgi:hypothetical protein